MKIESVAVLGAGAVGSYVLWGLSRIEGIRLGVVADGQRGERLQKNGCRINDVVYRPQVWTPKEAYGVDLLIVCLKYGALPAALDSIGNIVGENTIVMSLMNGIDSEDIIADKVGKSHIVYSVIKVASHKESNGYYFNPDKTIGIIFGESQKPYHTDRINAIETLFATSRLHYIVTEHIQEEMWNKFRLNVCNNLPQAVLGVGVGCYRDSEHINAIRMGLKREVEAIASAKGIDLSIVDGCIDNYHLVPAAARYSTLQDLDAGRHTEIDMFAGVLMRMGQELNIPTPYNDYTYHIIKSFEEKNDGYFDYV